MPYWLVSSSSACTTQYAKCGIIILHVHVWFFDLMLCKKYIVVCMHYFRRLLFCEHIAYLRNSSGLFAASQRWVGDTEGTNPHSIWGVSTGQRHKQLTRRYNQTSAIAHHWWGWYDLSQQLNPVAFTMVISKNSHTWALRILRPMQVEWANTLPITPNAHP